MQATESNRTNERLTVASSFVIAAVNVPFTRSRFGGRGGGGRVEAMCGGAGERVSPLMRRGVGSCGAGCQTCGTVRDEFAIQGNAADNH